MIFRDVRGEYRATLQLFHPTLVSCAVARAFGMKEPPAIGERIVTLGSPKKHTLIEHAKFIKTDAHFLREHKERAAAEPAGAA